MSHHLNDSLIAVCLLFQQPERISKNELDPSESEDQALNLSYGITIKILQWFSLFLIWIKCTRIFPLKVLLLMY